MRELFDRLQQVPEFKKACDILKAEEDRTWKEHQELVLIPAFSRFEEKRALHYQEMLEAEGFKTCRDAVNNVYYTFKGTDPNAPTVYMTAHIDTVFPMDTPLAITEKDGVYYCPGIGDDTASLAQVFGIMRAIRDSGLKFKGDLIIGGNVGEEGLGDLYGMKHFFFKDHPTGIDGFITVDGNGDHVTYGGTGSYRYEVTFRGPGGHSNGDFGMPNPIFAMGRAIAKYSELDVPNSPKTTFSIGVVDGGTSVNSIAISCRMLVDMRSNGKAELDAVDEQFHRIIAEAVAEENGRWARDKEKYSDKFTMKGAVPLCDRVVEVEIKKVGDRPVANQGFDATIVQAAKNAYESMGLEPQFSPAGSVDANIPISIGIPGLAVGCGGKAGGAHSAGEWFIPDNISAGQAKLVLLLMGLLGVEGVSDPLLPKRG
ncbi:MAG: M20/M25/M40 family metallo-hydrolase [Firmicutes bacterium]|nr:M20/M25/M40 family metallo-hydrolase [Bacillota bacterium]